MCSSDLLFAFISQFFLLTPLSFALCTAMKGMLHDLGFSRVEVVFPKNRFIRYSLPIRILSSIKGLFEGRGSFRQTVHQGRMSFHAYR